MDLSQLESIDVGRCTFSPDPEVREDLTSLSGYLVSPQGIPCCIVFNFTHGRYWQIVDTQIGLIAGGPYKTFRQAAAALADNGWVRAAHDRMCSLYGPRTGDSRLSVRAEFAIQYPMIGQVGIVLFPGTDESELQSSVPMIRLVGQRHQSGADVQFTPEIAYVVPTGSGNVAYRVATGIGPSLWWEAFDISLGMSLWEGASLDELTHVAPLVLAELGQSAEAADRAEQYRQAIVPVLEEAGQTLDDYLKAGQLMPDAAEYQRLVPSLFPEMGGRRIHRRQVHLGDDTVW